MDTNLIMVGLLDNKTKVIAENLSKQLNMYFADVDEILRYNFFDGEDKILDLCGEHYLENLKTKIFKQIVSYENTLIYVPFGIFLKQINIFKGNATIIYIKFTKNTAKQVLLRNNNGLYNDKLNVFLIPFDERDNVISSCSNINVEYDDFDENDFLGKIEDKLKIYFS